MPSTTDPPDVQQPTMPLESPPPPPLPTNSKQFIFSCKCLNVKVDGRVPTHAEPTNDGSSELRVWLGKKAEHIRFKELVTFEAIDSRPTRRDSVLSVSIGPVVSKRQCWVCGIELYRAGAQIDRKSMEEEWVTVDPGNGIRWGAEYEVDLDAGRLPFSSLLLDLPTASSQFGRPPNFAAPSLYPPPARSPVEYSRQQTHLLPPVHDPFFLPPPFIPSHPHLRSLCNSAVGFLKEAHEDFEIDIKHFIALKSRELNELEEKVRCEVELLWGKYCEGPGKNDQLERSRSASLTRTRSTSRSRDAPLSPPADNPIVRESITSPPYVAGTSLLSASISANAFHAPPPVSVPDTVDDSLMSLAQKHDKASDARAVAMSHIFSTLDEEMDKRRKVYRQPNVPQQDAHPTEDPNAKEDTSAKDSWIDGEKTLDRMLIADKVAEEGSADRTPRPSQVKELHGKKKGKVKFEDPAKSKDPDSEHREQSTVLTDLDQEDYVFDFEFDEAGDPPLPSDEGLKPPLGSGRNVFEASLSQAYAADAPSHRSAWRRLGPSSSFYASLKRDPGKDELDEVSDEGHVSKLATSMPMAIARPGQDQADPNLPAKERKTSLSDREGILVPPLIPAMRERGVYKSLGLDVSRSVRGTRPSPTRSGPRSASASRERERNMANSQLADPGALFEAIADEQDDDDEDEEAGDEEGTLRERGTFVPPHLQRKSQGREGIEAGWRSMVNE